MSSGGPADKGNGVGHRPMVLYVGGYGRSGSTVISTMLASHPDIVSIGEAAFVLDELGSSDRVCSCGEPYGACPFWGAWVGTHPDDRHDGSTLTSVERTRRLPALILGVVGRGRRAAYRAFNDELFHHAAASGPATIVVDSSKSAWLTGGRALALRRVAGFDVRLLHVVRDGRRTLDSVLKTGSNWELEGLKSRRGARSLRGSVGWVVANLVTQLTGWVLGSSRYLRLRHEDVLQDPRASLEAVARLLGVDLSAVVQRVEDRKGFQVGHQTGGNRVRFSQVIQLSPAPGKAARSQPSSSRLFPWVGGWLNRLYGYR